MIPAPFWKGGLCRDIILWVTFEDGNYQDKSSWRSAATATNFTASGDLFEVEYHLDTGSFPYTASILYGPGPAFNRTATDSFTMEGFFQWNESENNTQPATIFEWETGPYGGSPLDRRRFTLYANAGKVKYDDVDFGVQAGPTVLGFTAATMQHWAWVHDGVADTHKWYIDGIEVMSYTSVVAAQTANQSAVIIGGPVATNGGGADPDIHVLYGETRMVKRLLYSGPFTPPTPGNLPEIVCDLPHIAEVLTAGVTSTFGTITFNFSSAVVGDLLLVFLANCAGTTVNITSGWSAGGSQSATSGNVLNYHLFYKVATGGETSVALTLFSGSGMKSAVFLNVRGTDGTVYSHTTTGDHVSGAAVSAPALTSPPGSLSISALCNGDDFGDHLGSFSGIVSGSGWTEVADICSTIASSDQAGIVVATSTALDLLPVATGTFSRAAKGHVGASLYVKV